MTGPVQDHARHIGFIGLGNMGTPMVRRLAEAGNTISGYDASATAREHVAGIPNVAIADHVAAVAPAADIVFLMLPNSDVVEQVLLDDGLLDTVASGTLVVDMGSSEPWRTRVLAERAGEAGRTFVDAPVSGGVSGARAGSLTIMVGGPKSTYTALLPTLSVLGTRVVHAGATVGAGHAVKALNNLMSAIHLLGSSEAILAGQAFGLDASVMLDIVNGSSGRSGSTENKWPNFVLPGTFDSGFGLRLMLKDVRIALELERISGIPSSLSDAAAAAWERAAAALPADADHTEIARWVDGMARRMDS